VFLEFGEILKGIDLVQFAGVDQAHKQISCAGPVSGLVEVGVLAVQYHFLEGSYRSLAANGRPEYEANGAAWVHPFTVMSGPGSCFSFKMSLVLFVIGRQKLVYFQFNQVFHHFSWSWIDSVLGYFDSVNDLHCGSGVWLGVLLDFYAGGYSSSLLAIFAKYEQVLFCF